jgi:hypothetical protein
MDSSELRVRPNSHIDILAQIIRKAILGVFNERAVRRTNLQ